MVDRQLGDTRTRVASPCLINLHGRSWLVYMAIKTQRTITQRNIQRLTVMRPIGIVVFIGLKVATGHTHSRDRNFTLLLETTNDLYQGLEKANLLRRRECFRRSDQSIGHS